jgi:hypothetical protein
LFNLESNTLGISSVFLDAAFLAKRWYIFHFSTYIDSVGWKFPSVQPDGPPSNCCPETK